MRGWSTWGSEPTTVCCTTKRKSQGSDFAKPKCSFVIYGESISKIIRVTASIDTIVGRRGGGQCQHWFEQHWRSSCKQTLNLENGCAQVDGDIYFVKVNPMLKSNLVARFVVICVFSEGQNGYGFLGICYWWRTWTPLLYCVCVESSEPQRTLQEDMTLVCFSKVTYRIFTYWRYQCKSDTLVNTTITLTNQLMLPVWGLHIQLKVYELAYYQISVICKSS